METLRSLKRRSKSLARKGDGGRVKKPGEFALTGESGRVLVVKADRLILRSTTEWVVPAAGGVLESQGELDEDVGVEATLESANSRADTFYYPYSKIRGFSRTLLSKGFFEFQYAFGEAGIHPVKFAVKQPYKVYRCVWAAISGQVKAKRQAAEEAKTAERLASLKELEAVLGEVKTDDAGFIQSVISGEEAEEEEEEEQQQQALAAGSAGMPRSGSESGLQAVAAKPLKLRVDGTLRRAPSPRRDPGDDPFREIKQQMGAPDLMIESDVAEVEEQVSGMTLGTESGEATSASSVPTLELPSTAVDKDDPVEALTAAALLRELERAKGIRTPRTNAPNEVDDLLSGL